ncbi:MAG: alanine--tRNA ligase [Clostridiales bacterium]|nr:alanine--tRNA ligase [Clostridiales bacterium]
MEKLGLNTLREMFLSYFEKQGHYRRESFSLIPEDDPSLLLIGAGMAPLKPYFAGLKTPPSKRMTTCQKCIRTGDIENVGYTDRHGTFFEMLGNFSFGDYFKKEAITWGWDFATNELKMPEDRLWVTIYENDEEAFDLWHNMIGLPEEKIVRLGKEDNFWEIGTGGPCGPCSEIYFDRGEEHGCGKPDCKPGCECDRYVEFWNLVFTQFNKEEDGTYTDLPHPNIDTGLGLERLACIMQETSCIFDVDTIRSVLSQVEKVSGVEYKDGKAPTDVSLRIITDHLRSMTFMISDNILPGNEGRDYVLRRLIRRAALHGRKLGIKGPFLADLCDRVIDESGRAYPILEKRRVMIKRIVRSEEEKFAATIDKGMSIIDEHIADMVISGSKVLDGAKAFKLHDTYGFPIDLTKEIMAEKGYEVDEEGFAAEMQRQKELSRTEQEMEGAGWKNEERELGVSETTEFTGYETINQQSVINHILTENYEPANTAAKGDKCIFILDKTPFYAESGGQVSDDGYIYNEKGGVAHVEDVKKHDAVYLHSVNIMRGSFDAGDRVDAMVNAPFRNMTAANHSATHLLHRALREVLGDHVKQSGSHVDKNGLRFDFSHYEAMTNEEIQKVEEIVNDKISHFLPVTTKVMDIEDARKEGAMALFDEKYGDKVRVVSIGDYSREFCGGTHVSNSGQIGALKILSESGIASGVRRIEAVTGQGILADYIREQQIINDTAAALKADKNQLAEKASALTEEVKELRKEIAQIKAAEMSKNAGSFLDDAKEINGVRLITKQFDDYDINDLRSLSDNVKAENKNVVMVFASVSGGKVTFLVSLTDDLVEKGMHAGKMIKEIAKAAGGGGGGKADMAQAGAKDPSKVEDAFAKAAELL